MFDVQVFVKKESVIYSGMPLRPTCLGEANIRHVQEMLGHRHITSTQIYTHVTVDELSETYLKTHPAAKKLNTE